MPTCILKIQPQHSPYMGTSRGVRVLIALPNKAARSPSGEPTASFEPPYRVGIFGDFVDEQDFVVNHARRVGKVIRQLGFDNIEFCE